MGMLKLQNSVAAIDISGSQPRWHVDPEGKGIEYQKLRIFTQGPGVEMDCQKLRYPGYPKIIGF